jgi:hypothetical protein
MSDSRETRDEQASPKQGGDRSQADKAQDAQDKHAAAKDKMTEIEAMDQPPTNLEDWPDDSAKYLTYGGAGGDHAYGEGGGPEAKLGPSGLERRADGSILIDGQKVDHPEDHKGVPIPGGPTDPNTPNLPGEGEKRQKREGRDG